MATIAQRVGRSQARKVREEVLRSQFAEQRDIFGSVEFKAEDDSDGRIWFEGMANVNKVDRYGDLVEPNAFRRSLKSYLKHNPIVLFMHDRWAPIGRITDAEIRKNGLWVRGYVMPLVDEAGFELAGEMASYLKWVRSLVKQDVIRTLSIGFYPLRSKQVNMKDPMWPEKERKVRIIQDLELLEISFVSLPASRESTVDAKEVRDALAKIYGDAAVELIEEEEPPGQLGYLASISADITYDGTSTGKEFETVPVSITWLKGEDQEEIEQATGAPKLEVVHLSEPDANLEVVSLEKGKKRER